MSFEMDTLLLSAKWASTGYGCACVGSDRTAPESIEVLGANRSDDGRPCARDRTIKGFHQQHIGVKYSGSQSQVAGFTRMGATRQGGLKVCSVLTTGIGKKLSAPVRVATSENGPS